MYLGGKTKIARRLADVINVTRDGRPFWDPFCGSLAVSVALGGAGISSDAHAPLIAMYRAVQAGWDPPATLSEPDYQAARDLPDSDPLKAFAGFACSFGGKWFGGYARDPKSDRNYAGAARRSILKRVRAIHDAGGEFSQIDFLNVEPGPTDLVLYLDPPYRGTTGYSIALDHDALYRRVAAWSRYTDVFVSEYAMPWGRIALEFDHCMSVAGKGHQAAARTERLYHYGPDRLLDSVMR